MFVDLIDWIAMSFKRLLSLIPFVSKLSVSILKFFFQKSVYLCLYVLCFLNSSLFLWLLCVVTNDYSHWNNRLRLGGVRADEIIGWWEQNWWKIRTVYLFPFTILCKIYFVPMWCNVVYFQSGNGPATMWLHSCTWQCSFVMMWLCDDVVTWPWFRRWAELQRSLIGGGRQALVERRRSG